MPAPSPDPLATSVRYLKGGGEKRAEFLARLDLHTVADLLFYVPRDVIDLSHVKRPRELTGETMEVVVGKVVDRDARTISRGRTVTGVLLDCGGEYVRGTWFNQPWMIKKFEPNQVVRFEGKAKHHNGRWEFSHPTVKWLVDNSSAEGGSQLGVEGGIQPRYGLTEGLDQKTIWNLCLSAVADYADLVPDPIPEEFRAEANLPRLSQAVRWLHQPESVEQFETAKRRVLFDDLFEFQLGLAIRRRAWRADEAAPRLPVTAKIDARIRRLFPFDFTPGQDEAVKEIAADLASGRAMHRLLQADVGAGKTVVAIYAMLAAIAHGCQAVVMAPTELLANQHWATIDSLLRKSRVERRLLTGRLTPAKRKRLLDRIRAGEVDLVVGTQALIQEGVRFPNLGVAVIDEQHKFGVAQRAHFSMGNDREGEAPAEPHGLPTSSRNAEPEPPAEPHALPAALDPLSLSLGRGAGGEGVSSTPVASSPPSNGADSNPQSAIRNPQSPLRPHVLVMTATPIPRSLCLTAFGDLDLTKITDLPPGRQRVVTSRVTGPLGRAKAWEFIRKHLAAGRQAYIICPRISEGTGEWGLENGDQESVTGEQQEGALPTPLSLGRGAGGEGVPSTPLAPPHPNPQSAIRNPQSPVPPSPPPPLSGSVETVYQELKTGELKTFPLGLVHGRMDADAKDAAMRAFRDGETAALVSTTVVEVGVDVPNATLMVIYQADRFGLSQLHQLRGRIARGRHQGYCFLFTDGESEDAARRLAVLEQTADGFKIAEADFELRGPGDVLGLRQSGSLPLRVADLVRDEPILLEARDHATKLVDSARFDGPSFAPLKRRVLQRFGFVAELPKTG